MPSAKRVLADLKVFARGYFRNKVGLFFSLVFPIILILLFGSIFSGGSSGPIHIFVQNQDTSGPLGARVVSALNNSNTVSVTLVNRTQDLQQYLLSHSANQGVLIPMNFTVNYGRNSTTSVTVYSNPADNSSPIVIETVGAIVNGLNSQGTTHNVILNSQNIKSQSYKYIDFLIPGLVGFSALPNRSRRQDLISVLLNGSSSEVVK